MPMCTQSQFIPRTQHFLMSAYGNHWRKVNLAVFTVYVDDSGTSPSQQTAVAAALIIPAMQIPRLEKVWGNFKGKHGFDYLHSTEAAALVKKGQYQTWSDDKVLKVFRRARQITKSFATNAFVFAIEKQEFDAIAPLEWKQPGGDNHYTWAFRTLLHQLINWAHARKALPFEFVFDNAVGKDRDEIDMLMAQSETEFPGCFAGKYSFRCKAEVPALQCVDMLAWSSYAFSRFWLEHGAYRQIAKETIEDFASHHDRTWMAFMMHDVPELKRLIGKELQDENGMRLRKEWHLSYLESQKLNKTKRPARAKCPC